ncbi:hypothetical protein [Methylomonas sp. DH-1]|uniref:hypothetical protein n=1 Tax=Methylomonas sp. (strain DH-1) TaxID=1727196 RepID=UPI0007C91269|nr:hypothetical protein [Methylomonas sp. DH-1]ANE54757.1 hypothetical protein AYM39_05880 [Methylomonas sp. DH-1]
MDAYLPMIQSILLDWYQLTVANPEYAGAVAIAVWLLTSIFYSIRIYFLKKANAALVKMRLGLQADLEAAQQQVQSSQAELAASVQQLAEVQTAAEASAQRAAGLEEQVVAGNRQLIDSIKALANKFELTEPSLPAASSADNGELWNRYAAISEQAVERFQAEQKGKTDLQLSLWAESAKLAEKDALLEPLQRKVEEQTAQVAKLELALEEQKILFERQQANAEKALAATVNRYQTEFAEQVKPADNTAVSIAPAPVPRPEPVAEPKPSVIEAASAPAPAVVKPAAVEPAVAPAPVSPAAAPVETVATNDIAATAKHSSVDKAVEKSGGFGKFKQLLNNTMQQMAKLDQKLGTQTTVEVAEAVEEAAAPVAEPVIEAAPPAPVAVAEPVAEPAAPAKASKLKSLFGKSKPAAEAQPAPVAVPEPEPVPTPEPAPIPAAAKQDKLKDLFSKWK